MILQAEHALCFAAPELGTAGIAGSSPMASKRRFEGSPSCLTDYVSPTYSLSGPTKDVMSLICGYGASEQLLVAISEAAREFGDVSGCAIGDGPAWVLQDKLQEVHSCIVALDDKLHETPVSAAATAGEMASMDHCRQWLKHVQGYVLQLQKQITAFASDQQISSSSSSVMSVDDACSTSSSSTTAGTAVGEAAWRAMCQDSAKCLSRVAEHMMPGAPEDSKGVTGLQLTEQQASGSGLPVVRSSRLVAGRSCKPYSRFWARKIAL